MRSRVTPSMGLATRLALLLVAALATGAQCTGDPSVSCEVHLPSNVAGPAQWVEVGVLPGACPPASQLAGGLPITGLVTRVAFGKGNTSPPPIGSLKKGSYAFAAVARGADCSVLATGCSQVDVTDVRDVAIALTSASKPVGACGPGDVCVDSRCVPTLGGADASGAVCAMTLVGAGPLGDPTVAGADVVSGPAVAATSSGFLVAYREYDPAAGAARLTLASIDPSGGLTLRPPTTLAAQCVGQDESDAVGLDFAFGAGVAVSARPDCGSQPAGFDALQIDGTGAVTRAAFTSSGSGKPVLSRHAVAVTTASSGWLAYVQQGKATAVGLSGLVPQGAPVVFDGAPSRTQAAVAASGSAVSLLAGGIGAGGDAGVAGPTFELFLGASPTTLAAPVDFAAGWAAPALAGTRAIVLSDSSVSTQPLAWHTFDPPPGVSASATFAPGGGSTAAPSGGDIAVRDDLAFFAAEQPGSLSLAVFDHASTTPTLLHGLSLASDPRIPSPVGIRDGKVAVAASATQVLVSWVRGTTLGVGEAVGAWALYACGP